MKSLGRCDVSYAITVVERLPIREKKMDTTSPAVLLSFYSRSVV